MPHACQIPGAPFASAESMTLHPKRHEAACPCVLQRELKTTPDARRGKVTERKHRGRKKRIAASTTLPAQTRDEAREQVPGVQDVERDLAAEAERERYDIDRD